MESSHQFLCLLVSWPCAMGRYDMVWYRLTGGVDGGGEQRQQQDDFYQQWQEWPLALGRVNGDIEELMGNKCKAERFDS